MCKSKGRQKSLKEREAQKSILRKIKYTYNREKPLKFRDNAAILEAFWISGARKLSDSVRERGNVKLLSYSILKFNFEGK